MILNIRIDYMNIGVCYRRRSSQNAFVKAEIQGRKIEKKSGSRILQQLQSSFSERSYCFSRLYLSYLKKAADKQQLSNKR